MTQPEFPENFDSFDAEFQALVAGERIQKYGIYSVESLQSAKQYFLDCLVDHMLVFNDDFIDRNDVVLLDTTLKTLSEFLEHDFVNSSEIKIDNEIIAAGDTIALLMSKDENEVHTYIQPLSGESFIRGKVCGLMLQEIPPIDKLQLFMDSESDIEDNEAIETNLFGLSLLLSDATLEDTQGGSERVDGAAFVCIPLNYPTLQLYRIVKQEANS
jgi:hypothetical protein